MVFIWQRWGILAVLLPIIIILISTLIPTFAYDLELYVFISAVVVFLVGTKLNKGQQRKHTFFWIPMQWWASVPLALVILSFFQ